MIDRNWLRSRWQMLPGRQTLTLHSRQAGDSQGNLMPYPVAEGRLRKLTKEELPLVDAALAHRYRVAQLWQQQLTAAGAPDPKVNDQVSGTDESGAEFTATVKAILERKMLGECWNLLVLLNA